MNEIFSKLSGFVHAEPLVALAAASAFVFLGTLAAIPFILVRLPADYFDIRIPRVWMKGAHPVLRIAGLFAKNVAGLIFLLAGLAMLVLPGQGVLTILIGISLLDFPGKRRLEAKIVGYPTVFNVINSLREKFGRPPLIVHRQL